MFLLAALLALQPAPPADIVVRAQRTEAALAQCLAATCATPDDVRLSIASAELQFARGDYRRAQKTLSDALDRNRGAAARYPRMIAALHEAGGTVSLHRGDMDAYRRAMTGQAQVLRANLPENDPQVLLLAIQTGDYHAHLRDWREAERHYAAAERGYAARGETRLAALAALRGAHLALARGNEGLAESRLRAVDAMPGAGDPAVLQLRAVLRARIDAARGRQEGIEALLAALRTDPAMPPVLLHEAPYQPSAAETTARDARHFGEADPAAPRGGDVTPLRWADIGYMIAPDGTVTDVEVLRGSRDLGWTASHVKRVASRRYAPLALPPGQPGLYRVERFTLRARHMVPIGSLVGRPVGALELEVLDLTRMDAPPPG